MAEANADPLVQYIVMRRDLQRDQNWPTGSLIAQGVHAAIAALARAMDRDVVQDYLAMARQDGAAQMHKVVLEVQDADQLHDVAAKLAVAEVAHHVWVEHPEKIATCLATIPGRRSQLRPLFRSLKLFR